MDKKVILLTGASSGIGYQTAEMLAKQGHIVYGAARRVEKMEPLKGFGVNVAIIEPCGIKTPWGFIATIRNKAPRGCL